MIRVWPSLLTVANGTRLERLRNITLTLILESIRLGSGCFLSGGATCQSIYLRTQSRCLIARVFMVRRTI